MHRTADGRTIHADIVGPYAKVSVDRTAVRLTRDELYWLCIVVGPALLARMSAPSDTPESSGP